LERQPILKAVGIRKSYGSVEALRNIDFEVYPGEVIGLVGDNGAGKSTFIKILSGVHKKDSGDLFLEGNKVSFDSPKDAMKAGIETVYQDLALASHLDAISNIFLGREIVSKNPWGSMGFLDRKSMRTDVIRLLDHLKININSVTRPVKDLSGGQRQAVAIARSIEWGSKILIMDEPTAALGVEQSQNVLDLICEVRKKGLTVIFISHTLPHIMQVCDRIYVLRLGETITSLKTSETTIDEVISWITGSKTLNVKNDSNS
jgi:simple sugar transport system ATP-binding protein